MATNPLHQGLPQQDDTENAIPSDNHDVAHHEHTKSSWQLPSFLQFHNLPAPVQFVLNEAEYTCEEIFHCKKRGTTVSKEVMLGFVQFISCLYILPVVPDQLAKAGYDRTPTIVSTCTTCALGCIIGSVLTNMPFIIAPPTSVSIFLVVFLQQQSLTKHEGNVACIAGGILLVTIGVFRPLGTFITRLIPDCIQASTSVGIGLITALAGATEVHLVVRGQFTILDMGAITPEILIAMTSVIIVSIALHYHVKGAFCTGLFFGTIVWWIYTKQHIIISEDPEADADYLTHEDLNPMTLLLIFDLLFLMVLTLNGLARAMSDLAHLTLPNGAIPRGRWLFIVCGVASIVSGCLSGPPILISPESAAGIKAGAKTGLSTLICGLLFGIAAFFSPLFAEVPAAGTAPLLLMVGVLLFPNAKRIDWSYIGKAVPSFCCLFFIPFTYSILRGVAFGYVSYVIIGMFTGDFWVDAALFLTDYLVPKKKVVTAEDEEDGTSTDGPPPPSDDNRRRSYSMKGMMNSLLAMDMTHSDDNVVPITQEFSDSGPMGDSEDHLLAEQNAAKEKTRQKLATAQVAFQRLLNEAEIPSMSRPRTTSQAGRRQSTHIVDDSTREIL